MNILGEQDVRERCEVCQRVSTLPALATINATVFVSGISTTSACVVWPGSLVCDGIASLAVTFSFQRGQQQDHDDILGE